MPAVKQPRVLFLSIYILFLLCASLLAGRFVFRAIEEAQVKSFWIDESWSLEHSVRDTGYLTMLFKGPPGQLSPAPLDYIILKIMDDVKEVSIFKGMPPELYFRLSTIGYLFLSGLAVFLIFSAHIFKRNASLIALSLSSVFLLFGLFVYYFHPYLYYYALETRPYALWVSLMFVIMSLMVTEQKNNIILIVLLICLALTSTASVFIILSLALGHFIINAFSGKPWKEGGAQTLLLFTVPVFISGLFLYRSIGGEYTRVMDTGEYQQHMVTFWGWYKTKLLEGLLCAAGLLMSVSIKRLQPFAVIFLSLLFLLGMVPILNYITLSKGVYFTQRHYLYLYLIIPFSLMSYGVMISEAWSLKYCWRKWRCAQWLRVGVIASVLVWASFLIKSEVRANIVERLNQFVPKTFAPIVQAVRSETRMSRDDVMPYWVYYKIIVKHRPGRADAHGLLGFMQYQLGKTDKSIRSYNRALELNPHFFWYYYNLGIIYREVGDLDASNMFFEKGLQLEPIDTIKTAVKSSLVYMPLILAYGQDLQTQLKGEFYEAQKRAYWILAQNKKASTNLLRSISYGKYLKPY